MFTESLIERKVANNEADLEMYRVVTGTVYERLPLNLGSTTLSRVVETDGTRGPILINTMEDVNIARTEQRNYILKDGKLVTDSTYDFDNEGVKSIKFKSRVKLLFKVLFGKPDHWDRETDFYGCIEEE